MKDEKFSLNIRENPSLSEILDKVMDTGVVIQGELIISLADVDLMYVSLQVLLSSVENLQNLSSSEK